MTKEQIEEYDYCRQHLIHIENCKKDIKFGSQKYGCGTGRPNIEYSLEKINNEMYKKIMLIFEDTKVKVQKIISNI